MSNPTNRNKAKALQARKLQNPEVRTARTSFRQLSKKVVALAVSCVPRDAVVETYQYEDEPGFRRLHDYHNDLYGPFKPTGPKYLFR